MENSVTITTDASLHGWGAHLDIQGQKSLEEAALSINLLELRAISVALLCFTHSIRRQHVLILTNNMTAEAHVNRQGALDQNS